MFTDTADQCEVLCASVLFKSGLENRDYGRRGSATLTMRHPSIRKSWHQLRRQAAVGIVRSQTKAMELVS
jgi:hypothetical protein